MSFQTERPKSTAEMIAELKESKLGRKSNRKALLEEYNANKMSEERQSVLEATQAETDEKNERDEALESIRDRRREERAVKESSLNRLTLLESAKKITMNKVLFEMVYDAYWLDDDVKKESIQETYNEYRNVLAIVENVCGGSKTKDSDKTEFIKNMESVVEEACKKAVDRIIKEQKETGEPTKEFEFTSEEESDLDKKLNELGRDEIVDLVKKKVLTVVQDERKSGKEKAEMLKELDKTENEEDSNDTGKTDSDGSDDDNTNNGEPSEEEAVEEGLGIVDKVREIINQCNWKRKVKKLDHKALIEEVTPYKRKEVHAKSELDKFYRNNDYCIECVSGDNELCQMLSNLLAAHYDIITPVEIYVVSGKDMNKVYDLYGDNAYQNDVHHVIIPLNTLKNKKDIVSAKGTLKARYFNDVVDNNEYREYEAGRHKKSQQIQWLIDYYGEPSEEKSVEEGFFSKFNKKKEEPKLIMPTMSMSQASSKFDSAMKKTLSNSKYSKIKNMIEKTSECDEENSSVWSYEIRGHMSEDESIIFADLHDDINDIMSEYKYSVKTDGSSKEGNFYLEPGVRESSVKEGCEIDEPVTEGVIGRFFANIKAEIKDNVRHNRELADVAKYLDLRGKDCGGVFEYGYSLANKRKYDEAIREYKKYINLIKDKQKAADKYIKEKGYDNSIKQAVKSSLEVEISLTKSYIEQCEGKKKRLGLNENYQVALESMIAQKQRRSLKNSMGGTLFESLMIANSNLVRDEVIMEGTDIDTASIMNAALIESILQYTVLETLNTTKLYKFTSADVVKLRAHNRSTLRN